MKTSKTLSGALILSAAILGTVATANADTVDGSQVVSQDDHNMNLSDGRTARIDNNKVYIDGKGDVTDTVAPTPYVAPTPTQQAPQQSLTPQAPVQAVPTPKQETPKQQYATPSTPVAQQAPVKTPDAPKAPATPKAPTQATPSKTPSTPTQPATPKTPDAPKQATPSKTPSTPTQPLEPKTPKAPKQATPSKTPSSIKQQSDAAIPSTPKQSTPIKAPNAPIVVDAPKTPTKLVDQVVPTKVPNAPIKQDAPLVPTKLIDQAVPSKTPTTIVDQIAPLIPQAPKQETPTKVPNAPIVPLAPVTPKAPVQATPTKVPTTLIDQATPKAPQAPTVAVPPLKAQTPSKPLEQVINVPIKTFPQSTLDLPTQTVEDFGTTVIVNQPDLSSIVKGFADEFINPQVIETGTWTIDVVQPQDIVLPTTQTVEITLPDIQPTYGIDSTVSNPTSEPTIVEQVNTLTPKEGDKLSIEAEKPLPKGKAQGGKHLDPKGTKSATSHRQGKPSTSQSGQEKVERNQTGSAKTESAKTQQAVSKLIAQSTERNTLPKTGESSIVGTILTNIGIGLVVLVGGAWLVLFKKGRHQK